MLFKAILNSILLPILSVNSLHTTEQVESGNLLDQVNDTCYYSLAEQFSGEGTAFHENILTNEYLNNVKFNFVKFEIINESFSILIIVELGGTSNMLIANGSWHENSEKSSVYFTAAESNEQIESFVINEANEDFFLHDSHRDYLHMSVLRIAAMIGNQLVYLETLTPSKLVSFFKSYDTKYTKPLFDASSHEIEHDQWQNRYSLISQTRPKVVSRIAVMDCSIEAALCPTNEPYRSPEIPTYIDNYYLMNLGEAIIRYSVHAINGTKNYIYIKRTYPYYVGGVANYITYTAELEIIDILPGDTRYEWTGQTGYRVVLLQQRTYAYYKNDNRISEIGRQSSYKIENVKMSQNVRNSDLAWRKVQFYGNAQKDITIAQLIRFGLSKVENVGIIVELNKFLEDANYDPVMNVTNVKLNDSYLSTQLAKKEISTSIAGSSVNYYLLTSGQFFHLEGSLVIKESISITGLKSIDTIIDLNFRMLSTNEVRNARITRVINFYR